MTKIDSMASELNKLLQEYAKETSETTKDCVNTVAKKTLSKVRNTSPKKTGKYKKSWRKTVVTENANALVVSIHNEKYSLVHLLEKGHQKRGGGRVAAIPHVAPAEQGAIEMLEKEIRSKI